MRMIISIVFFTLIAKLSYSQSSFNESIKDYDDNCFCNIGLLHPSSILGMDSNWEIVFALKEGKTLQELKKHGINFSQSQIRLLELSNIIKRKDSIYTTIIPTLPTNETELLRKQSKEIAKNIIPRFQNEFDQLTKILKIKGLENNCYSIFFSYALDGIVWDILQKRKLLKDRNLDKKKPLWNGVFWLIKPKRDFFCGTNSLHSGDLRIYVNSSPISKVKVSNYKVLQNFLDDYNKNDKITDTAVFRTFDGNGLFDNNGALLIPIIKANSTDTIYRISDKIANTIVDYLDHDVDYSKILSSYPNLAKGEAIVILYHEIMWDILDILEINGQIKKPIAFGEPDKAKPKDLKDLIFIVKD